jgi:DNA processing protein
MSLIHWIAVSHLRNVSLSRLNAWLHHYGSLDALFTASKADLLTAGFSLNEINSMQCLQWEVLEKELSWYQVHGDIVTITDPDYPALLKEIADPPLVLYGIGDRSLLSTPQIAMVGSRHPSPAGDDLARHFAYSLAESGLTVTSGLAIGIDSASHEGALQARGKTIAVMGTGLNHTYPVKNRRLAEKIMQQGLILSEFSLNTLPHAWNFPQRNRLISGLSLGVLVVEAALRSGSLITARYALEQNREVFAIPGSVHNPMAKGCHWLINQGAKLVESVEDILNEFQLKRSSCVEMKRKPVNVNKLDVLHQFLLKCVDYSVTPLEMILQRSRLTASEVSSMLLTLELEGYIQTVVGGYCRTT